MLIRLLLFVAISGLICFFHRSVSAEENRQGVRMICLNIGKGDAILLSVEGRHYLVDTGYKRSHKQVMAMLTKEDAQHLDAVFITHPHKDHVGGLEKLLLSGIDTDAIYAPALSQEGSGSAHPAVQAAAKAGRHVQFLNAGDSISVSNTAYFEVIGPRILNTDNENNNSLVMNLVSQDGVILLTGDMKAEEEATLLKADALAPCDVLKVPFHGFSSASSAPFLRAVRPRVSVISTSSIEEKDTPAKDTLNRLSSVGSKTYVTQGAKYAVIVSLKMKSIDVRMSGWDVAGTQT